MAPITWSLREVGKTESTQRVADELASEGAAEGVVVLAEEQEVGRGRYERRWLSPRGGIYMSLVLRPRRPAALQLLPMLGSLAIVDGIRMETGAEALMRWPNDVLLQGKKVAGVIAEASYRGGTLSYVILGMGINCNFRAAALGDLAGASTTLMDHLGAPLDAPRLRDAVLSCFGSLYEGWSSGRAASQIAERRGLISTVGKTVEIRRSDGGVIVCRATGIEEDGSLVAELDGREVVLRAEDVERLRELPDQERL